MIRRFIFVALCLATASATLGQNVRPASAETPGPRPIAKTEGRKILATIPTADVESESETDCSHFVHDVYERAGFPYDYVSSRELYVGSTNFTRVRSPQAGDLVVWRGHVGIVIDPKNTPSSVPCVPVPTHSSMTRPTGGRVASLASTAI